MSGNHPSDETLQLYGLDRAACRPEEIEHIDFCPDCQATLLAYGILADALGNQPAPVFDFDLAAAVAVKIRDSRAQERAEADERAMAATARERKRSAATMAIMIAAVIGVPAWLFRKSAYFVFTDMSAGFYWVLLGTAALVVGLFIIRLHKKYQDVINLINK